MRRRRLPPDTRPPKDAIIDPQPPAHRQMMDGQLELIDRMPLEVKQVVWERGWQAGYAAYQAWRSARVRGQKWNGGVDTRHAALFSGGR